MTSAVLFVFYVSLSACLTISWGILATWAKKAEYRWPELLLRAVVLLLDQINSPLKLESLEALARKAEKYAKTAMLRATTSQTRMESV